MLNIYVGNLPYTTGDEELQQLFSQFGEVQKANIIMDRETGRSRGFGFVEMTSDDDGRRAIEELTGQAFNGRPLTVNEARPRSGGPAGSSSDGGTSAGSGYSGRSGSF